MGCLASSFLSPTSWGPATPPRTSVCTEAPWNPGGVDPRSCPPSSSGGRVVLDISTPCPTWTPFVQGSTTHVPHPSALANDCEASLAYRLGRRPTLRQR